MAKELRFARAIDPVLKSIYVIELSFMIGDGDGKETQSIELDRQEDVLALLEDLDTLVALDPRSKRLGSFNPGFSMDAVYKMPAFHRWFMIRHEEAEELTHPQFEEWPDEPEGLSVFTALDGVTITYYNAAGVKFNVTVDNV